MTNQHLIFTALAHAPRHCLWQLGIRELDTRRRHTPQRHPFCLCLLLRFPVPPASDCKKGKPPPSLPAWQGISGSWQGLRWRNWRHKASERAGSDGPQWPWYEGKEEGSRSRQSLSCRSSTRSYQHSASEMIFSMIKEKEGYAPGTDIPQGKQQIWEPGKAIFKCKLIGLRAWVNKRQHPRVTRENRHPPINSSTFSWVTGLLQPLGCSLALHKAGHAWNSAWFPDFVPTVFAHRQPSDPLTCGHTTLNHRWCCRYHLPPLCPFLL